MLAERILTRIGRLIGIRLEKRHMSISLCNSEFFPAQPGLYPNDCRPKDHPKGRTLHTYGLDQSGEVTYRFNSAGFRSEPFRTDAEFRIMVLGESVAFGVGVTADQTPGSRMAAHLSKAWSINLEMINTITLALPGASSDFCTRQAMIQIDRVRPNLVVCILPSPDRIEQVFEDRTTNYTVTAVDNIDAAPIPVQAFVDFYGYPWGLMNLLRNTVAIQTLCRARGVDHILSSQFLAPEACLSPIHAPLAAQIDRSSLVCHQLMFAKADKAKDNCHAGPKTSEALALTMLSQYASGLMDKNPDLAQRLSRYIDVQRQTNADWRFVLDAVERAKLKL